MKKASKAIIAAIIIYLLVVLAIYPILTLPMRFIIVILLVTLSTIYYKLYLK